MCQYVDVPGESTASHVVEFLESLVHSVGLDRGAAAHLLNVAPLGDRRLCRVAVLVQNHVSTNKGFLQLLR